jgi:hypothetical protein
MSITHLKRREIQAPVFASLVKEFSREIGYEKTMEIIKKVIREDAIQSGRKSAHEFAANTLAELASIVREVWGENGAIKISTIRETDEELFFDVTYCGYAEMYKKMGIRELGFFLSCYRDFPFLEGFNPEIELERTKTMMEGADCCDFRYVRSGGSGTP